MAGMKSYMNPGHGEMEMGMEKMKKMGGYDHKEHMVKIENGLRAILATPNIEEAHSIAQSLMKEEGEEMDMMDKESPENEEALKIKIMKEMKR